MSCPDWYFELLSVKELADRLKYTPRYVYAMRRDGFEMPGNRASVQMALDWLRENPDFAVNRPKNEQA
jgi:hypothetical protein